MSQKPLNLLWGGITTLLLLGSCQDEDFGYSSQQIVYQSNFEKAFGKLSPNQIWDFSSYNLNRLGLEGGPAYAGLTRADAEAANSPAISADCATTSTQSFTVPQELRTWIETNLRETEYHKQNGATHFTIDMPADHDVVIIPIYQGQSGQNYNLCLKSEEETPAFSEGYIWQKSSGIECLDPTSNQWQALEGRGFYDHTVRRDVKAKPVCIKHTAVAGNISFYLDLQNLDASWDGNGGASFSQTYATQKHLSSADGQMEALSLNNASAASAAVSQALSNLSIDGQIELDKFLVIGCEESNIKRNIASASDPRLIGSDWDMNELVFLVVGITPEDLVYTKDEVIAKRYMIEDLGSSFDYDFNDIVIDVTQKRHINEQGESVTTQTLSLRHLCGTIPWQVKVGNYTSPILPGRNGNNNPDGFDPTVEQTNNPYAEVLEVEITGWDPDANNITVTAWPEAAGEDIPTDASTWTTDQLAGLKAVDGTSYSFPATGEYPFIIACDVTQPWTAESQTISADAIVTWTKPEATGNTGTESYDGYERFLINIPTTPEADGNYLANVDTDFDAYTTDIVIDPTGLQNLQSGYKIVVQYSKINEANDALMYINAEAPWEKIGGDYELQPDQTSLEVNVTTDNIALLKAHGITLKGKNVHISTVTIVTSTPTDGELLTWSGNQTVQWGNGIRISTISFADAQAGDQLIITANKAVRLTYIGQYNWVDFGPNNVEGSYTLTAQDVENLKKYPLLVRGDNVTVTRIELYRPEEVTLTLATSSADGIGSGTVQGDGTYRKGTTVTLKAIADQGSVFVEWMEDGNTNAERNIELNTSLTYTAKFAKACLYTIQAMSNDTQMGTVAITPAPDQEGNTKYYEGTEVTLTAQRADDCVFVKWTQDGEDYSTAESVRLTVNASTAASQYVAVFRAKTSDELADPYFDYGTQISLQAGQSDPATAKISDILAIKNTGTVEVTFITASPYFDTKVYLSDNGSQINWNLSVNATFSNNGTIAGNYLLTVTVTTDELKKYSDKYLGVRIYNGVPVTQIRIR